MRYGLGNGFTARPMTGTEVAALLARHPWVAAKVAAHNALASVLDCTNVPDDRELVQFQGPIPGQGIRVDDVLGEVVIFPDATCDLRYTLLGPEAVFDPGQLDEPWIPEPVPHEGGVLEDLGELARKVPLLLVVGLGLGAYMALGGRR